MRGIFLTIIYLMCAVLFHANQAYLKGDTFQIHVKNFNGSKIPFNQSSQISVEALKAARRIDVQQSLGADFDISIQGLDNVPITGLIRSSDSDGGTILEFSIDSYESSISGRNGDRAVFLVFSRSTIPRSVSTFVVISKNNTGHNEMSVAIPYPALRAPAPKACDPIQGYGSCYMQSNWKCCRQKRIKRRCRKHFYCY